MLLTVKLVGTLSKYLPDGSKGGVIQVDTEHNITIFELMKLLGLPPEQQCIISINDDIVPISERKSRTLQQSDNVKFIPALKGG